MRVKLTLGQASQVEWAIGPMRDDWCTDAGAHDRDGPVKPESALPRIEPHVGARGVPLKTSRLLVLSGDPDITADLLYRLEVQLSQMVAGDSPGSGRAAAAGRNAAKRIRHILKYHRDSA